jgi:hypothetical protein
MLVRQRRTKYTCCTYLLVSSSLSIPKAQHVSQPNARDILLSCRALNHRPEECDHIDGFAESLRRNPSAFIFPLEQEPQLSGQRKQRRGSSALLEPSLPLPHISPPLILHLRPHVRLFSPFYHPLPTAKDLSPPGAE